MQFQVKASQRHTHVCPIERLDLCLGIANVRVSCFYSESSAKCGEEMGLDATKKHECKQ